MTQLYAPADFDRLIDEPWDSDRVRDKIAAIVKRIDGGYRDETSLWPANEWDRWQAPDVMKNVYVGAAGVVWALDGLYRRGFAGSKLDLPHLAVQTLHRFRDEPDYMTDTPTPEPRAASLLCGEAGILLVAWRLNRSDELADELFKVDAGERRQRRGRADVGRARDDDRRTRDGAFHARATLDGRLEHQCGRTRRAAQRRRHLDAASLRRNDAISRAGAWCRRQRPRTEAG